MIRLTPLIVFILVLLAPALALADDSTAAATGFAGTIAATLGIVLGLTRLVRASEDALHTLLPERLRWLPAAVLLALGGVAVALPSVTDWWGYAAVGLGAVGVVVVAAMQGAQKTTTTEKKQRSAKLPLSNGLLVLLLTLTGCVFTPEPTVADATDAACAIALIDEPAVQQSAADRGINAAELAELLCGVAEVANTWDDALKRRTVSPTPAALTVLAASERGLL